MAIKPRRKVINTQMNKEIKVIKLDNRRLREIISGRLKDKCYLDIMRGDSANRLWIYTNIMGNVWDCIFVWKIINDLERG